MLAELNIRNLGIIDSATIQFDSGFTAFTGETGAGKTMIIEAINLLVGGRSEAGMVRHGCTEARVEGRFIDPANSDPDTNEVILCRVIPADGRSRAYINGNLATVGGLAEIGARLVDLHGQHAHQSLLHEKAQREALDTFANIDLSPIAEAKRRVVEIDEALAGLGGDEQSRNREIDLLRFQVEEILAAEPAGPDEDEELRKEEELLGNVLANRESVGRARDLLADEAAASDLIRQALAHLHQRDTFPDLEQRLVALAAEAEDIAAEMRGMVEGMEEDPQRLAWVSERRRTLKDLCRKYGPTLADVQVFLDGASKRLADLESHDERARELDSQRVAALAALQAAATKVGNARKKAAPMMAKAVEARLRELALPTAEVGIVVPVSSSDPSGEAVNFLITTNPGSPPAPLAKVASGGELARVMLALRLVLTQAPPTLVFDEVDAGIGGRAAVAVGAALREVARHHQVFVVTHLPQVAAQSSTQVGISKTVKKNATFASARVLSHDERVDELARMLSGGEAEKAAIEHARELLAR
jgi:DNA repair protein RecN (Recombination protein N)